MLLDDIVPKLRATIPRVVHKIGCEDDEELIQDAIVMAAQILDSVERKGRKVTPGNVAYYAILHMKSGRRSHTAGRSDVMYSSTQLDQKACVLSMEEEVGFDEVLNEPITLGELLADEHEDPSLAGARNVDWNQFLDAHDPRYRQFVTDMLSGRNARHTAKTTGQKYAKMHPLKTRLAEELREYLGGEAIHDAVQAPRWKASVARDREKTACRADRRRA